MAHVVDGGAPYKTPEQFSSMTIHLGLFDEPGKFPTVDAYFDEKNFALTADLAMSGFDATQIEEAVNGNRVEVAHWPEVEPKTDFYWSLSEKARDALTSLASQAVELCYGQDEQVPVGGNFMTVGVEMGSQQMALAGLIYARAQGTLREIVELDNGTGPLYVVRDSFSGKMFEKLLPEVADNGNEGDSLTNHIRDGIVEASPEHGDLIVARDVVVTAYCKANGINKDDISMEQLLEIRALPEWQDPFNV